MFYTFKPFNTSHLYKFKDPDTGFIYEEESKEKLIQRIVNYRAQNQLSEIKHLDIVLDNYLCKLPENVGRCKPGKISRSILKTIRGGIALATNLLYESFVSQEEADRRAGICVKCPHNVFPDKSDFVRWSDDIAVRSTDGKKSKLHDQLGNCEVCSCNMRAKVFFGGAIQLNEDEKQKMIAVNCWQPEAGRLWKEGKN